MDVCKEKIFARYKKNGVIIFDAEGRFKRGNWECLRVEYISQCNIKRKLYYIVNKKTKMVIKLPHKFFTFLFTRVYGES